MSRKNLVYIGSLRNAAADKAGQEIEYKGSKRYMKSPLEYLAEVLNETPLGSLYSLQAILFDDDEGLQKDREKLIEYGFSYQADKQWFYPENLTVQGKLLTDITCSVPSTYRRYSLDSPERIVAKRFFEKKLLNKLTELKADIVLLDGLLIILDELVRPESPFYRKIFNIHPGITRIDSPYERRGAYGTLDALYAAKGEKVINWETMEKVPTEIIAKTGASFHYVDNGIDSGEVIVDVLKTDISPDDSIFELRWNNFNKSLFPAIYQGLSLLSDKTQQ